MISYFREVLLFLFLGAVSVYLVDAEIRVGSVAQGNGPASSAQLLLDDHVVQVTSSGATVVLLHGYTQKTEFAEFFPKWLSNLITF